ncbi:MAG: alpha-galactosidase [Actinobacteria bacterium]|nr:alpha-galactosidase [Actinomycetota bacterium]
MLRVSKWIENGFLKNMIFSFVFNGNDSKKFLGTWDLDKKTEKLDNIRTKKIFTFNDPKTNLEVCCETVEYSNFPAVEWVIYFKNTGNADTPIIEDILALDTIFSSRGEYNVHYINGCSSTAKDFAPKVEPLSFLMNLTTGSVGGRSSNGGYPPSELGGSCPFFNLEEVGANRGIMLAIGWTGQWMANFDHETESTIHVKAGMELTHLKLYPGEQIRTPSILLIFWEGSDYLIGNNLLRRFIISHKLPKVKGEPIKIPIAANSLFHSIKWQELYTIIPGSPGTYNTEKYEIAFARMCKKLGIEYYWLDLGWHEEKGKYSFGTGSWFPNKAGFPNGLKPLSRVLKEINLKFILWFEPERVCTGSWLWDKHPEWVITQVDLPKKQSWNLPKSDEEFKKPNVINYLATNNQSNIYMFGLLDLGNLEARKWLTEHISGMIKDNGIDVYRHDCNIDPLSIWRRNDSHDRQGITEIRHIEGLYAFWDELLRQNPGLIIDCVASGNRRIDIETISRSISLTTTDYSVDPIGLQCQTYGLTSYMPVHATGIQGDLPDKYRFRSIFSGGANVLWDIRKENFPDNSARTLIEEVKRMRPLAYGDFWPLTPYSLSKDCWIAWQFDREDLGKGAVYAFRRSNLAKNKIKLFLKGIREELRYEIKFVDTDTTRIFIGKELAERGLEVNENKAPVSVLITYKLIE